LDEGRGRQEEKTKFEVVHFQVRGLCEVMQELLKKLESITLGRNNNYRIIIILQADNDSFNLGDNFLYYSYVGQMNHLL
jgi:hypothetical protein